MIASRRKPHVQPFVPVSVGLKKARLVLPTSSIASVPDLPPPLFPFFVILTAPLSLPFRLAGHTFGSILLPCVPPLPFTLLIVPLSFLPLPFPPLPQRNPLLSLPLLLLMN